METSQGRSATPSRVSLGLGRIGPAWFTSVMGTGILAVCIAIAPIPIPFGAAIARALWSADALLFSMLVLLATAAVIRDPRALAATFADAGAAQAWGAPPMAAFTIAVGFLRIGEGFFPHGWCVAAAQALWVAGALGSVAVAFAVPYQMFTRHDLDPQSTAGHWLMPVVAPIVASVPAALLSSTWPAAVRSDMLALAYGLLGIGMILAAIVIVIFYGRLVYHKVPAGALVTTMWLVIGPLGQSIAGMIALGTVAPTVWPAVGNGLATAALAYGVLAWGFAIYWLLMSIALTMRAYRHGLPFTLGWWAFTFPVGVLTAGTDALYLVTRAQLFAFASIALVTLLAALWSLVAFKTLRTVGRVLAFQKGASRQSGVAVLRPA